MTLDAAHSRALHACLRHQTRRLQNHLPHRRGRDGRGLQSQGYPTEPDRRHQADEQGEFQGRFTREARAIAALNHPNVCQLYDVGPNYLVMEHVSRIYRKDAAGRENETLVFSSSDSMSLNAWSRDGRSLVYDTGARDPSTPWADSIPPISSQCCSINRRASVRWPIRQRTRLLQTLRLTARWSPTCRPRPAGRKSSSRRFRKSAAGGR